MSAAIDLYATLVQQVDAVVASTCARHSDPAAGPTIAQIEYTIDTDWSGDDAIHFLVIVHDPPAGTPLDFKALRAIARDGGRGVCSGDPADSLRRRPSGVRAGRALCGAGCHVPALSASSA